MTKGAGSILNAKKAREQELLNLLVRVAVEHDMQPAQIQRATREAHKQARYAFCYLAARDTSAGMKDIAKMAGYNEWSAVSYAIRQHCVIIGEPARSFLEVRQGVKVGTVDWIALRARVMERMDALKLNQVAASRRCGVPRRVIQRVLEGTPVNADAFVSVLLGFAIPPEDIITAPLRALLRQVRS